MKRPERVPYITLSLALLIALLLVACAPVAPQAIPQSPAAETAPAESTTAAPAAAEPARKGGKLVYIINQEGDSLDPASIRFVVEGVVAQQIYDPLVFYSEDFEYIPWLAESWENSEDYKTWTFHLRQGVTFHDGTPMDAQAVADSFARFQDPEIALGSVLQYFGPEIFEGPEVVDEDTVRLVFKTPQPNLLMNIYLPYGSGVVSPTAAEKWGKEFGQHPVGTGPFMFKEWVRGDHITLVKNPDYDWAPEELFDHQGPAYIDELEIRFITENQPRLVALETGEADFIDRVPFQDAARLTEDENFTVLSNWMPGMPQMNYINCAMPPTDDIRVRKAINYAVNKEQIVQLVYFGTCQPAYSVYSANLPEFNPATKDMYPHDPDQARALLEEAGWVDSDGDGIREKDGEKLSVTIMRSKGWNEWVEVLQANLQEVGFDASIIELAGAAYSEAGYRGEYHLPSMGSIYIDVGRAYTHWHSSGYGVGWAGASNCQNDRLDELLEAIRETPPGEERTQMAYEIQEIIMEEAMEVPIVELFFHTAMKANLKGHKADATTYYHLFYDMYFEE